MAASGRCGSAAAAATKASRRCRCAANPSIASRVSSRWSIDGSSRRNLARYANHACRPNAESDLLAGKIVLRAIRTIRPGDEITYDYGQDYFDLFLRKTGCKCATCLPRS